MADDELDELYWVKLEDFTATRTRIAKAARERGDDEAAKQISACRKPTTAAWVVNRLAISHTQTTRRLTDLREKLQAAHASSDGGRIRELTRVQRELIEQLAAAAFDAAEVTNPSAALRDDVSGTLSAAVADPDVTARLGRLAKPERWSGFGDFGAVELDSARDEAPDDEPDEQLESARTALAAAEQAKTEADEELSDRHGELQDARRQLKAAQRELKRAEDAPADAEQVRDDAAGAVKTARAELKRLGG
jgi:chromosome segregation ATPase